MLRYLALCAISCAAQSGPFGGLATTQDGSAVYFTSALRFKATAQPLHEKLFIADRDGVRLLRSRERVEFPPGTPNCTAGNYYRYSGGVDVASDGTVIAAVMGGLAYGTCSYPVFASGTNLITPASDTTPAGIVRLSANGRFAISYWSASTRLSTRPTYQFLDVRSGATTSIELAPAEFPVSVLPPSGGSRVIADDGTALINYSNGGWIARPGRALEPFPVPAARLLAIDAAGTQVLYNTEELRTRNLRTGEDRLLDSRDGRLLQQIQMSDDGRRVLLLLSEQLFVVETASGEMRPLATAPLGVLSAAISGNGRVVYAATGDARLIRIDADSGTQTEVIGRSPFLSQKVGNDFGPGTAYAFLARGLATESLTGVPPLQPWLGDLTMWVAERKVPVLSVSPTLVHFLVPWDMRGQVRVVAEAPARNSPFDFPEAAIALAPEVRPVAGAVVHQDWSGLVTGSNPARPGEIVHIYALGLGPVQPEVEPGVRAPVVEPLSRTTRPFTCRNATVRFAGLAPGGIERFYQVDLEIGPETGLVRYFCSLGGDAEVVFAQFPVAR